MLQNLRFLPAVEMTKDNRRQQVYRNQPDAVFGVRWGLVTLPLQPISDLEGIYQNADRTLYVHKQANRKPTKTKID